MREISRVAPGASRQRSASPRAAAASRAAQGPVGDQGNVRRLKELFESITPESVQNSTKGSVGALGTEHLQLFEKDPTIKEAIELMKKVEQAIGEPIEGEPDYSSLFEKTLIQTANDCIKTLEELKQWIIKNRLLHGKDSSTTHAREFVQDGINPLTAIKSNLSQCIHEILKDKKIQQIDVINDECIDAIRKNNCEQLQIILYDHIQDIPTLTKLCRNLKHCGLVKKIDEVLKTLEPK